MAEHLQPAKGERFFAHLTAKDYTEIISASGAETAETLLAALEIIIWSMHRTDVKICSIQTDNSLFRQNRKS